MKFKAFGIMISLALIVFLAGCTETANNANSNINTANTNVNANANVAVANQNANTDTKKAPTRAEYEKNKQSYAEEAKRLGRSIGSGLDDGWLWTKSRFDLAAANDLRDSTINVDVENAVVTLSGTVATAEQKAKAVSVVKSVEGVKSVKDLLKVAANTNSNTANSNTANSKTTKKK